MTIGTARIARLLFELKGKHTTHPFGIVQGTRHAKTEAVSTPPDCSVSLISSDSFFSVAQDVDGVTLIRQNANTTSAGFALGSWMIFRKVTIEKCYSLLDKDKAS